jgi:thiamine biosynthesis protein ThiS
MKIFVNGKEVLAENDETLGTLLQKFLISQDTHGTAVAVGEEVVPQSSWKKLTLKEGDRIEIVRAVQGG